MKNYDLSDILSALEQDGKDSRRRQQITQTINHLESRHRRKVLYFSISAACVALLLLPVAINLILNRHPSSQPIYISAKTDTVIKPAPLSSPPTPSPTLLANNKQVKPQSRPQINEHHNNKPQINELLPEVVSSEDNIDTIPSFEINDSQIAESSPQQPSEPEPSDPQPIVTTAQPTVSITQEPDPQPSQPPKKVKKRRHFRLANPSNMDGTVLAFNLKK